MTQKFLWRGLLIAALSVALATPARANQLQTNVDEVVAGIVIVSAGIAVLVTVLVLRHHHHEPKDKMITGCVESGASGISMTNEKDKQQYALAGNTADVKQGDRVTLVGTPSGPSNARIFGVQKVGRNFGACPP